MVSHLFDGTGVCVFCDACDDETCCGDRATTCDRRVATETMAAAARIREKLAQSQLERGRP